MDVMNKNILIRADGSKSIGMGHLNRAILIINYLLKTYSLKSTLLTKNNISAIDFLGNKISDIITIPESLSITNEIIFINNLLKKNYSLLILDILENDIDISYTDGLKITKKPILAITDDSFKRQIDVDVVVNGNPLQKDNFYPKSPTMYCVGPKYFIMDEVFSKKK